MSTADPLAATMTTGEKEGQARSESPEFRAYVRKLTRQKRLVLAVQVLLLLAFIGIWQLGATIELWDPLLTSSPWVVAKEMVTLSQDGTLWTNTWTTLQEILISAALAYALGLVVAIALWWTPFVARVLDPYLVVMNAMPKVALAPLFYIFLGQTFSTYGIAIAISVIVTIIMIYTSFSGVEEDKIKLLRTFGATRRQILSKVVLPHSTGDLIAAGKVGIGLTLVGVIVGEFVSAKSGLGYQILYGSQIFNVSLVMAAIVMLVIISVALYGAVSVLERFVRTRPS